MFVRRQVKYILKKCFLTSCFEKHLGKTFYICVYVNRKKKRVVNEVKSIRLDRLFSRLYYISTRPYWIRRCNKGGRFHYTLKNYYYTTCLATNWSVHCKLRVYLVKCVLNTIFSYILYMMYKCISILYCINIQTHTQNYKKIYTGILCVERL